MCTQNLASRFFVNVTFIFISSEQRIFLLTLLQQFVGCDVI